MKRLLALFVLVAALCVPALSAGEELTVKVRTDVLSDYIFRGQVQNDSPVMQSEVKIERGIYSLRLWGNTDLTDRRESQLEFSEFNLDFKLEKAVYSNAKSKLLTAASLFGGVIYYSYPEINRESTTELYAGVDATSLFDIHARVTVSYDVDEVDGGYVAADLYKKLALPFSFNIGKSAFKVTARPEVGYGWGSNDYNRYYWGTRGSCLTDWHAGLAVMAESERFEFGPSVKYTDLIDGDIQDQQNKSSNIVYGFSLGMKF